MQERSEEPLTALEDILIRFFQNGKNKPILFGGFSDIIDETDAICNEDY